LVQTKTGGLDPEKQLPEKGAWAIEKNPTAGGGEKGGPKRKGGIFFKELDYEVEQSVLYTHGNLSKKKEGREGGGLQFYSEVGGKQ